MSGQWSSHCMSSSRRFSHNARHCRQATHLFVRYLLDDGCFDERFGNCHMKLCNAWGTSGPTRGKMFECSQYQVITPRSFHGLVLAPSFCLPFEIAADKQTYKNRVKHIQTDPTRFKQSQPDPNKPKQTPPDPSRPQTDPNKPKQTRTDPTLG